MATVPACLRGYLGDSSLSAGIPAAEAVEAHRERRRGPYADLTGALAVEDRVLADVVSAVDEPLDIDLVITGGAGAIEPAVIWAARAPGLSLRSLVFTLRDEDDLAHNARRLSAAVDAVADLADVPVFAGPPPLGPEGPSHGWLSALDELASREHGLVLRLDQPADGLAAAMEAALDRELPFRAAGAAGAVSDGGSVGFVNLLVATRAAWDGEDATVPLGERDGATLLSGADLGALERARRWCAGVAVPEPGAAAETLVVLGLLEDT